MADKVKTVEETQFHVETKRNGMVFLGQVSSTT